MAPPTQSCAKTTAHCACTDALVIQYFCAWAVWGGGGGWGECVVGGWGREGRAGACSCGGPKLGAPSPLQTHTQTHTPSRPLQSVARRAHLRERRGRVDDKLLRRRLVRRRRLHLDGVVACLCFEGGRTERERVGSVSSEEGCG